MDPLSTSLADLTPPKVKCMTRIVMSVVGSLVPILDRDRWGKEWGKVRHGFQPIST